VPYIFDLPHGPRNARRSFSLHRTFFSGVGFSYSDDPSTDYKCNDDTTANDSLQAVEAFFAKFPEMLTTANGKARDFFLTGESYGAPALRSSWTARPGTMPRCKLRHDYSPFPFRATPLFSLPPTPHPGGIYVPTLAEAIVKATKAGTYKGAPLRGIAVGNGCTGTEIGVCGGQRDEFETEFLLGTAFVQPELKDKIRSTCQLSNGTAPTANCAKLLVEMHEQVGYVCGGGCGLGLSLGRT
jgi:hypothetical protein